MKKIDKIRIKLEAGKKLSKTEIAILRRQDKMLYEVAVRSGVVEAKKASTILNRNAARAVRELGLTLESDGQVYRMENRTHNGKHNFVKVLVDRSELDIIGQQLAKASNVSHMQYIAATGESIPTVSERQGMINELKKFFKGKGTSYKGKGIVKGAARKAMAFFQVFSAGVKGYVQHLRNTLDGYAYGMDEELHDLIETAIGKVRTVIDEVEINDYNKTRTNKLNIPLLIKLLSGIGLLDTSNPVIQDYMGGRVQDSEDGIDAAPEGVY